MQYTITVTLYSGPCLYSLFTNMAKSIAIRHGGKSTNSDYLKSFPPFLWILRDTVVRMPKHHGKELTPTEYLKTEILHDDNPASMEVAVHRVLTQFFPSFVCETLPPPSVDLEVMETITTKQEQLNPLFNQGVDKLIAFLKTNVQPKKVFNNAGAPCDGHTLALLVQEVAKAVNDPNSIPALDNTWKLVVQSRCRDVQEKLIAEYRITIKTRYDRVSKGGPLEEEIESGQEQCASVIGIHNQLWTEIKEKLHKEIGPLLSVPVSEECTLQSVTSQLENQLAQFQLKTIPHTDKSVRKVIGGALYAIAEENRKRSREYCNKLFTDLYTQIKRRVELAEDGYTAKTLEADLVSLKHKYNSKSVGPEKLYVREKMHIQIEANKWMFHALLQRAQDCRETKEMNKKISINIEEQRKQFEKRMQAEEERRQKAEKRLDETQKSLDEQKKLLTEETRRLTEEKHRREKAEGNLQQMNRILEERQKVAQERLDDEKKRTEKAEAHLETVTDERDKLKEQLTKAVLMKDHAEEKLAEESKRHADLIKAKDSEITKQTKMVDETKIELKKEKEDHKMEAEQLTKDIDEKTKEAKQLAKDIAEKTKEVDKLAKEIKDKTKEAGKLAQEIKDKTKEAEELEQEIKDKTQEIEDKKTEIKAKTKEIKAKTEEIEDKTKQVAKLKKYIKEFENSNWFMRMIWRKRHDEQ